MMQSLIEKLQQNDPFLPWLTLSNSHIGCIVNHGRSANGEDLNLMEDLASALSQNTQVRKVSCHAPFLAHLSTYNLRLLLKALASTPNLQEVWMALPPNRSHLSSQVIETLLAFDDVACHKANDIQKFTLRGVNADGCCTMARALACSRGDGIVEVHLYGTSSTDACCDMALMLQTNKRLQQLTFPSPSPSTKETLDHECCQALADALCLNSTLTYLAVTAPRLSPQERPPSTLSSTSTTTSKTGECRALVDMLIAGQNQTLCWLKVDASPEIKARLSLYTGLNRAGINKHLICNYYEVNSRVDLLDLLATNNQNVSMIYHIFCQLPHLVTTMTPCNSHGTESWSLSDNACEESAYVSNISTFQDNNDATTVLNKTPSLCVAPSAFITLPEKSDSISAPASAPTALVRAAREQSHSANIETTTTTTRPTKSRRRLPFKLCLEQSAFVDMNTSTMTTSETALFTKTSPARYSSPTSVRSFPFVSLCPANKRQVQREIDLAAGTTINNRRRQRKKYSKLQHTAARYYRAPSTATRAS